MHGCSDAPIAQLINKTLGAWNKALGYGAGSAEADSLKERIEALEKLLSEANAEVARLNDTDRVEKCASCQDFSNHGPSTFSALSPPLY